MPRTFISIPCCLVISHFLVTVVSFNIDVKDPIFFKSENKNDYYGYSVGLLRNREGQYALITAPRANSSFLGDQLYQPGVLLKCKISFVSRTQSCTEVVLDAYGNTITYQEKDTSYRDKKDNMFLGVSLDVQQNSANSRVVTCGHLWKNQYYAGTYLTNGACYVINNELDTSTVKKLVPLVAKESQSIKKLKVYYYAFAQMGTSAAFSEDGKQLFLGMPGFYDWTGTILSYSNPVGNRPYVDPVIPTHIGDIAPESYIGYSVTSGKFFNSGETFIASGAPRDKNSYGQVYIIKATKPQSDKFPVHVKKEGTQFGEYFGAAVLGVDFNKDDLTDLLVGAPFHSSESGGDEGKVYVFISNGMVLQQYAELYGEFVPNSRFGSCIASVGDLNQDGFNDVAIGAPYEHDQGAVYIYHGTSTGMNSQYVQRLQASEISTSLSGFGISVSHGVDVDGNYYPDILIGSYESSEAVLFRTHPVIKITGKIDFSSQQINTNVTSCEFEGKPVSCINITTCIYYTTKYGQLNLTFETQLHVDFRRQNNKARSYLIFEGRPTSVIRRNITARIGEDACSTDQVIIRADAKDVITPVDFLYVYNVTKNTEKKFCKTCPVVDQTTYANNVTKAISFQTGCGQDNQCLADLVINASIAGNLKNATVIIGQNTTLTINIDVTNYGEPAYISELLIHLSEEMPIINKDVCTTLLGDQQKQETNTTLLCDLGNPLSKEKTMTFQIKIDISKVSSKTEFITIMLQSRTGSTEINPSDNDKELKIYFKSLADVAVRGAFEQELIQYDDVKKKPILVSHTYFVMNHGPSPIEVIDIELNVPTAFRGKNGGVEFVSFNSLQVDSGEPLTIPATCNDFGIVLKPIEPDVSKSRSETFEGDLVAQKDNNRTARGTSEDKVMIFNADKVEENPPAKRSLNEKSSKKKKTYVINCETADCVVIKCVASPFLNSRKFARISINLQLNISALDDILDPWYRIEYFTNAKLFIRNEKSDIQPEHNYPDEISVKTIIVYPGPMDTPDVELWIIYLSVGIGVLLLIIILIVLIKLGFFTRQQKEKMREMMTHGDLKEWEPYLITNESEDNEGEAAAT